MQPGGVMVGVMIGMTFGLTIGVVIGAVIFRAAVALANKLLGGEQVTHFAPAGTEPSSEVIDVSNPYSSPSQPSQTVETLVGAIPEPGFGRACLIVLIASIIGFVINFLVGFQGNVLPQAAVMSLTLLVGFLVSTLIYKWMLPTTLPRAALVYLFQILIILAIALMIGGILLVFGLT